MRGLDHTRSRLPAARAFFAGVAILAGAFAPAAQASGNDETAMAVPRVALPDANSAVALPQPLNPSDAVLVRRAFVLQARGDLPGADRAIAELHSDLLLGHLLAARDLGRFHRATAGELTDWLGRYASEPDAPAMHALLLRRLPKGAPVPPLPAIAAVLPPRPAAPPVEPAAAAGAIDDDIDPAPVPRQPAMERSLAIRLARGGPQSALRLIDTRTGLPPAYAALLRGEIVRALFTRNDDAGALHVARLALGTTPPAHDVGLAAYIGGLAAWRLGHLTEARQMFARAADAPARLGAAPGRGGVLERARRGPIARSGRCRALAAPRRGGTDDTARADRPAIARAADRDRAEQCAAVAGRCGRDRGDGWRDGARSPCCRSASRRRRPPNCAGCGRWCGTIPRCAALCCWWPPAWVCPIAPRNSPPGPRRSSPARAISCSSRCRNCVRPAGSWWIRRWSMG